MRFIIRAAGLLLACSLAVLAQETTHTSQSINLSTALRLAGAQNLDVEIARAKLAEAIANHQNAVAQFFPWIAPGIAYRQHDGAIQDVAGNIIDVHKQSYAPGASINAEVHIGDAYYKSLSTKKIARAATHGLEAQRQDAVFAAAQGYFELAQAQGAISVARDALKTTSEYEKQIRQAVVAGLAFKGDALRVQLQSERNQSALRQAIEKQKIAGTKLAQILRLDPLIELSSQDGDIAPLALIETNIALHSLVSQALSTRPEIKQSESFASAAQKAKDGAVYGPLIPTLGGQAFFGTLDGGRRGISDTSGGQQDYFIGASWRIGPGGLFDFTRTRTADSRLKIAQLNAAKHHDEIKRQVLDAYIHWQSVGDQLASTKRALSAAEEGLRLAKQRKEFAVGVVLETIQAEQDLTRSRLDYLKTISDFNTAQYALSKATGKL